VAKFSRASNPQPVVKPAPSYTSGNTEQMDAHDEGADAMMAVEMADV